jgi:AraC-like DNA-binding protein
MQRYPGNTLSVCSKPADCLAMNHLIRASSLNGYVPLATSLGLDAARELRRFGLSTDAIGDAEGFIAYRAMVDLLEHSAVAGRCPAFGLRLSRFQSLGILGPLAVAIEHAATVGESLKLAAQYLFVHSPAARLEVKGVAGRVDQVDVAYAIDVPGLGRKAQALELALGVIQACFELTSNARVRLRAVLLPHARLGALSEYDKVFGVPCLFEQSHAAIRLNASDLAQPLNRSDDLLKRLAQTYLDSQFTAPETAFADRVRLLVQQRLASGQVGHGHIAQLLAVHPRTMQRRLREEGTRFETIKDDVRRSQFQRLIDQPGGPSISAMAGLLDYAEPSALTRSARRWFGKTPSQLRPSP